MNDLVEALRAEAANEKADPVYGRLEDLLCRAAGEIERLRSEVSFLRKENSQIMGQAEQMVEKAYAEAYEMMRGKKPMPGIFKKRYS